MWRSCRYHWVSASFGSTVSLSEGVSLWDESVSYCVWLSCTFPSCVLGQDVVSVCPVFVLVCACWVFPLGEEYLFFFLLARGAFGFSFSFVLLLSFVPLSVEWSLSLRPSCDFLSFHPSWSPSPLSSRPSFIFLSCSSLGSLVGSFLP